MVRWFTDAVEASGTLLPKYHCGRSAPSGWVGQEQARNGPDGGRLARLLAVLMGLQAGLPALFFDRLAGRRRQQYFAAVRAGLGRDYEPMAQMFSAVIERTLQIHRPH
jgi:hypothetical protein